MQTANQRRALGRYSHVRMVPVPDWLPQRRAPRSNSGRAKASGLAYERATIAAIRLAFSENKQTIPQLVYETLLLRCIDLTSNSNISQSNRIENKQIDIGRAELFASQWIEYKKNNIIHLCQPDLLIIFWPKRNLPTNHLDSIGSGNVPGSISLSANHFSPSTPYPSLIICCEIKLTYTPVAIKKLRRLYLPLVDSIFHPHILLPLIICKNLTGASPPHSFSLLDSLSNHIPLITYSPGGNFHII